MRRTPLSSSSRTLCLFACLLCLALGTGLAHAAHPADRSAGERLNPAGVYILTRADGRPLPYAFTADLGAGEMTGDLIGARVTLRPDGGYDADLVVRIDPGVFANLPGVPASGLQRTVQDRGRYVVRDGRIVLTPAGLLTKRYDAQLHGRVDGTTLVLTQADLRGNEEHYELALEFKRIR